MNRGLSMTLSCRALVLAFVCGGPGVYLYLADESAFMGVVSLLWGFAPIAGLFLGVIVLALLYSVLVWTVEKEFDVEQHPCVPDSKRSKKWRIVWNSPAPSHQSYLSLKEHSPPRVVTTRC